MRLRDSSRPQAININIYQKTVGSQSFRHLAALNASFLCKEGYPLFSVFASTQLIANLSIITVGQPLAAAARETLEQYIIKRQQTK